MSALRLAEEPPLPSGGSPWELLWVIVVLVLIIAAILLLLRFVARRGRGWWANHAMRHLGGMSLGPNKSMQIVEWNGRIYILGVGENVTLLEVIHDPETVARLLAMAENAETLRAPVWPDWLRRIARRPAPGSEGGETDGSPFEQSLQRRLRELSERRARVEQLLQDHPAEDRTDQS
jgi:flagellar protein FliO/FliZ